MRVPYGVPTGERSTVLSISPAERRRMGKSGGVSLYPQVDSLWLPASFQEPSHAFLLPLHHPSGPNRTGGTEGTPGQIITDWSPGSCYMRDVCQQMRPGTDFFGLLSIYRRFATNQRSFFTTASQIRVSAIPGNHA